MGLVLFIGLLITVVILQILLIVLQGKQLTMFRAEQMNTKKEITDLIYGIHLQINEQMSRIHRP